MALLCSLNVTILETCYLQETDLFPTPIVSGSKLKSRWMIYSDATLYKSVVALQHATITKPNINYPVKEVCQFMAQPLKAHWLMWEGSLGTSKVKEVYPVSWGLLLRPISTNPLSLFSDWDVDWGLDSDDRLSTLGACVFLSCNLVSW